MLSGGNGVESTRPGPAAAARDTWAAEWVVFHGAPFDALALADPATPRGRWLSGVAAASLGRYVAALDLLRPLVADPPPRRGRLNAALAAATLGGVERQLDDYEAAARADRAGLSLAGPFGAAGAIAVADCRVGLVADAVGMGERGLAATRLTAAARAVADCGNWRPAVRLGWVRAEVALLRDEPADAARHAGEALVRAQIADASRHVAKSLLFLGVAKAQVGRSAASAPRAGARAGDRATGTLRRATLLAADLRTLPLLWPACAVLAGLLAGEEADGCRLAARAALLEIASGLPEPLHARWLALPDRAAVLSAASGSRPRSPRSSP